MKLLYLTPAIYNSAGTERVLSMKVNYLIRECGYEVVIVTTDQHGRANAFEWDERIRHYDLGVNYDEDFGKNIICKWWSYIRKNRLYKNQLQRIIDHEQPDICISLFGKELEWWNKMHIPGRSIAELHFHQGYRKDMLLSQHQGLFWQWLGDIRIRQMIRQVCAFDQLIVLTKEDQNKWKGLHPDCRQIYNPLPEMASKSDTQEPTSRRKTIIAVGRLTGQKNYPSLIRVWKQIESHYPDWELEIWGDGEEHDMLEQQIRQSGLNHLYLRGNTNHIDDIYRRSSILVMSSRYEGFSMVLLEALNHGLPIVSYACPCGPREVIEEGVNGYLITPNDEQAMAQALGRLIQDEELRPRMGEAARIKAQQFTPETILPQWPALLENR